MRLNAPEPPDSVFITSIPHKCRPLARTCYIAVKKRPGLRCHVGCGARIKLCCYIGKPVRLCRGICLNRAIYLFWRANIGEVKIAFTIK